MDDIVDKLEERVGLNRFRHVSVHAGILAAACNLFGSVCSECDDRNARPVERGEAIQLRRLDAVHHGHVHVHEDEVELLHFQHIERGFAIFDNRDPMTRAFEDLGDDDLIGALVLCHENGERFRWSDGRPAMRDLSRFVVAAGDSKRTGKLRLIEGNRKHGHEAAAHGRLRQSFCGVVGEQDESGRTPGIGPENALKRRIAHIRTDPVMNDGNRPAHAIFPQ